MTNHPYDNFWQAAWIRFKNKPLGLLALSVIFLFILAGIYAPFLASSKPLFVIYDNAVYFPLFRYLFYKGFFTTRLDLFFNLLIFTFPIGLIIFFLTRNKIRIFLFFSLIIAEILLFLYVAFLPPIDPSQDLKLSEERRFFLQHSKSPLTWEEELKFMNPYAKLNLVIHHYLIKTQHEILQEYIGEQSIPTLWHLQSNYQKQDVDRQEKVLKSQPVSSIEYRTARKRLDFIEDKKKWIEKEIAQVNFILMPWLSSFHWEDDAAGQQSLNQKAHWMDLTRINRKDLIAALVFGIRISLVVGIASVAIALMIGLPIGAVAGFYGGSIDIFISRLLEIWEAMPTFFMLLMITAILQTKSIFIVILIIGLFGWTSFTRYLRGEFLKQRNFSYVEACHAQGFKNGYIMFTHILPNALPPVLTLLPFAIMGAITAEAGLSFLGLGEEGSPSWGTLMDEGRSAFPQESYLLWPPAILLTILLVSIAVVGDSLRDALDPKRI